MGILHLQKVVGVAGAEHYLMALLPALLREGIDVSFLGLVPEIDYSPNRAFFEKLEGEGVKTHQITVGKLPTPYAAYQTAKIAEEKGAWIHSHLLFADVVAVEARLLKQSIRVVSTKHGFRESHIQAHGLSPDVKRDWYWWLARRTERLIERSFAVSHGLRELYVGSGISDGTMDVIHHGWLPGVHNQSVPGETYRLSSMQVVVPGRLVPYKGQEYAIRAFAKVVKKFPDAQMILVGDGPHRSALEKLTGTLKLGSNVRFLGWRTDIFEWMLNSDLALVPSIGEGFGLVFLEAYKAGLPIVAFDVPAANEIVEPEKSGLLAPLWDTVALGDSMIRILGDDQLRLHMGIRAKELIQEKFSFERVVDETFAFYKRAGILRN